MSATLVGNQTGSLTRKIGTTRRGEPIYADRALSVRVDVIRLNAKIQPTSVRTDSSATRGNAEEMVAAGRVLFQRQVNPQRGDRFVIHGVVMRIESIEARVDTFGDLDHWDCTLVLRDDEEDAV